MDGYHWVDRTAQAIGIPTTATTTRLIYSGAGWLMGWSWFETTGAATATVELFDGLDTTGQTVVVISLNASQSTRDWLGPNGLQLERGGFINVISGSVRGSLWIAPQRGHGRQEG